MGCASLQEMGTMTYLPTRICWIHQGTWLMASAQRTRASNAHAPQTRLSGLEVKARCAPRTAPLTEGPIGGTAGGPN